MPMLESRAARSNILTVNTGSSSLRLASHTLDSVPRCSASSSLSPRPDATPETFADFIDRYALAEPAIVVHRVVHGGTKLVAPCVVDAAVETEIERLGNLAPLHNGIALEWIRSARAAFGPNVCQAACFDTEFFADLPAAAANYALPRELCQQLEIRRYGFHGLAHQSLLNGWHDLRQRVGGERVISLQLGAGCSISASEQGRPIATSMGFSPLGGLVMANRCGDLDPAVVLHLIEQGGFTANELRWILNESSGLLALSGITGDMKALLGYENPEAELAIQMFCARAGEYIGAYLTSLRGADAILIGGGIGQHAPTIRATILEPLKWAGIRIDDERNRCIDASLGGAIHSDNSTTEVWFIPTHEESVMAAAARSLLFEPEENATMTTPGMPR